MEERWKFHDMMRDVKRKKMRGEFTPPTNISTELFVKILLKYQEREEKWRKEDTVRIKNRIEYRKKHPRKDTEDRRWLALTRGESQPRQRDSREKEPEKRSLSLSRGSTF